MTGLRTMQDIVFSTHSGRGEQRYYRIYVVFRCKPLRLDGLVLSSVFFTPSPGVDEVTVLAGLVWEIGGADASVVFSELASVLGFIRGTTRALSTHRPRQEPLSKRSARIRTSADFV